MNRYETTLRPPIQKSDKRLLQIFQWKYIPPEKVARLRRSQLNLINDMAGTRQGRLL
jgi:hypothetical protein